ncbi:MAG: tripartite tricarboxylate transporter permease, partial [Synergistaceae bacterium]|nr:tripartite tricarboxylate transporter permease [Synergistaceae bacterium]
FLLGIYAGGTYGGSITAILIRTPGTISAAATVLDGYPMAQQGRAAEALSIAAIASFIGGIFSCVILIILAPRLARVALLFGPAEYFSIGVFGLSIVASLSTDNFIKGFIAAALGLLIATIGMDPITGSIRLTFGNRDMMGGIEFIPVLIGLFAISEVILKLEGIFRDKVVKNIASVSGRLASLKIWKANIFNIVRSSVIGVIIGIIPATGAGTACWIAYNEAKRTSKNKELFGKGAPEGVIAPEAANNAVTGGALVPLLTLGVPGDVVTAVILGAFMIHGLSPGPELFRQHAHIVTGIYAMLILANIFMLIIGLTGIRVFTKILKIPTNILMPLVFVICLVGAYASNLSIFNMQVALLFGVIGYIFNKANFPVAPVLLGIILEPIVESNFRRAIIKSHGSFDIFLQPISLVFLLISLSAFLFPILAKQYGKYKTRRNKTA